MLTSLRQQSPARNRTTATKAIVCVVDRRPADYSDWQGANQSDDVEVRFVSSAAAALRQARLGRVDLWVINADLQDISGLELCGMLRSASPQASVCIVADEYSVDAERAAWQGRATMFECKPFHLTRLSVWLAHWRSKRRIAA